MRFSVSIPTIRPGTIQMAIESIQRQTVQDWELIVVGQGPDKSLAAAVAPFTREDSRIRYIHLDRKGLSYARNVAIAEARGDVMAFTDDDCEADCRWLEVMGEYFDAEPELGFVAGPLLPPPLPGGLFSTCPQVQPADVLVVPGDEPPSTDFDFAGGNWGIRRNVALRIGPMDEYLGAGTAFAAAEDLDYKIRLTRAKVRMRSVGAMVVNHTYGVRYGLDAVYRHRRGYATGQGALAAKLTLDGDRGGEEWMRMIWNDTFRFVRKASIGRAATGLMRYWYAKRAYDQCLRKFTLDREHFVLKPAAER